MSMKEQAFEPQRREFLRRVTLGSGAASLLIGTGIGFSAEAQASTRSGKSETEPESTSGYHLTEHIREYYRKAAF